jgi:mannosyl-3-phosphoglycerate phosphatase
VVFSDVESLLESPACLPESVTRIRRAVLAGRFPLVVCSTRTRAEIESIQRRFGFRHPFVSENGAAVYVPRGYFPFDPPGTRLVGDYHVLEYGRPYRDVVEALDATAQTLRITVVGFHHLPDEAVAQDCRLTVQQAQLAKRREYGEPFRIVSLQPDQRPRLFEGLAARGFGCTAGGRYDYVGAASDEVAGIRVLSQWYSRAFGPIVTVGLGDQVRDTALLQCVQVPVVVKRDDADPPVHLIMKRPAAPAASAGATERWRRGLRQFVRRVVESSPLSAVLDYRAANH